MSEKSVLQRLFTETWPAKVAQSAIDALFLPGQVAGGQLAVQPSQPDMWSDMDEARQQANQSTMMDRTADLGGLVMGGSYVAAPAMKNASGMGIRAYHGSPHDFDRFDLSKIGTGEGAQAYGHGLYFAEKEGVARAYRDALGPNMLGNVTKMAEDYYRPGNVINTGYGRDKVLEFNPGKSGYDWAVKVQRVDSNGNLVERPRWHSTPPDPKIYERETGKFPGRMYEVNINARPEQFLDWDKPLSQMLEVRSKLEPIGFGPNMTGEDIYKKLVGSARPGMGGGINSAGVRLSDMPPREVSGRMNATGIPGIKYLDQGSRGAGQGSSNYVVFDDKLIDILRKYGLAGGSVLSALFSQGNEAQAAP